jgi:hypothetical protein
MRATSNLTEGHETDSGEDALSVQLALAGGAVFLALVGWLLTI